MSRERSFAPAVEWMAFQGLGEEPLRLRSSSVRERRARSGRQPRLPENLERTGCQVDGNSRDDLLVLVPELEQTSVSVVVLPCSPGFLAGPYCRTLSQ